MPIERLSAQSVQLARCPAGKRKIDLYDDRTVGFVVEVRASGGKTYYLRYQDEHGRQKQHKIGAVHDISFDQAQKTAKRLRSQVVLGEDPAAKKKEKKAVLTYDALADRHLEYAESYQKAPENTASVLRVHLRPKWGKMYLDEIDSPAIAKWLAEKRAAGLTPATVTKIRVMLSRSFELALRWNLAGVTKNPVRGIPHQKFSNARDRFLTQKEAERLRKAVAASSNPQLSNIVGLLLLTGARKTELLRAEWKHINLEQRTWLIPTSKNGRSRHVPLSQAAIDIIKQLPRWEKCGWLLPNPKTKEPYNNIKRAWQTARKEAGLEFLRIHDLRHAAASMMVSSGVSLYTVGKVLCHVDPHSTQIYAHVAQDALIEAVEAGAAKLNVSWVADKAA